MTCTASVPAASSPASRTPTKQDHRPRPARRDIPVRRPRPIPPHRPCPAHRSDRLPTATESLPRIPDRARQPHPHNRSRRMTPSTRPQHTQLDSKTGFAGSSRASAGSRSTRPRADTRRRDVGRTAHSGSGSRRHGSRSPARWSDRPPTRRGLPAPSAGAAAEPR